VSAPSIRSASLSNSQGIVAVTGPNFSGRSDLLREITGLGLGRASHAGRNGKVYVGPEVYNDLSGLAATVLQEIQIHADRQSKTWMGGTIEALGLDRLSDKSPYELSGGEQALLAIFSAMVSDPSVAAIDGALEQVDRGKRRLLLELLESSLTRLVVIADNRFSEYDDEFSAVVSIGKRAPQPGDLDIGEVAPDLALFLPPVRPCRITLQQLRYHYSRKEGDVLHELSMELEPGRLYILEGRNGAGKSTLAKLLSGVLLPSAGVISVNGIETNLWEAPGKIVGYHFQNPDLQLFSTNVREELSAGLGRRLSIEELDRRVELVSAMFGVQKLLTEHPLDLPFTLRKRVALAATIVMGRPWLILDEPTLSQDDSSSDALAQTIKHLTTKGMGIVVISHSEHFKNKLSGQLLSLVNGTVAVGK
jgi:energy-coupling factor transporter ATP-binding protein EcfA2